jgi:uncharacterized OB-fold protein
VSTNRVRFDLPAPDGSTQPFWDAARVGRLLIRRCGECGAAHFYPRPFCPACWSSQVTWEEASGRAVLYTYSIVYQNDLPPFGEKLPYIAAIVDLEEGPRMMTRVVDCEHAELHVGMAVEVTFQSETDEVTLPVFRPRRL